MFVCVTSTVMNRACYAHSVESVFPEDGWEPLKLHLQRVAEGDDAGLGDGAAGFAAAFGAGEWGRLAGWWHDLGKYSDRFQDYLLGQNGLKHSEDPERHLPLSADHKTFGAKLAATHGPLGRCLAFIIAGHHNGMPDDDDLDALLAKAPSAPHAPEDLLSLRPPSSVDLELESTRGAVFQLAFFTRMVFSALVDADFLATELFMDERRREQRTRVQPPPISDLATALDDHLRELTSRAAPSPVNQRRAEVLRACRTRASDEPGFFSLTVPTGGGKSYSSLAFALEHTRAHGLRRVVYAAPFTSIIEQNADGFRRAVGAAGDGAVLEHHSNFEPDTEDAWSRLASENWDAPLVVTTNVQLFESLFSNRPGRCRKLHRVAKSVIVLDEAQAIPVNLLAPTLAALKELVRNYGCTVVLCTATQPALHHREDFPIGVEGVREITPDVPGLFGALERVKIERRDVLTDEELAAEIAAHEQVLSVVHTRPQARDVYRLTLEQLGEDPAAPLDERATFHLSAAMCPAHRSRVIELLKERLRRGRPCRVVSTSLIEAGVDIDFPVVYRAMAGLDSVAQAAGRCNREGRLDGLGRVVVYDTESPPPSFIKGPIESARTVARDHDDLLAPETIRAYFEEHYWMKSGEWDRPAAGSSETVMGCFEGARDPVMNFETAARLYRLIMDDQAPVVVPWGERGRELIEQILTLDGYAGRALRRRCQRYAVGVRKHALTDALARGAVQEAGEKARGLYVLARPGLYDDALGLDPGGVMDPEWLIG